MTTQIVRPRPEPTDHAEPPRTSPVLRLVRVVGGWGLLAVGAALLVLPGPGLLVLAGGLALLATEYPWAARLLTKVKQKLASVTPKKRGRRGPAAPSETPEESRIPSGV
jgi:hypothetical protein